MEVDKRFLGGLTPCGKRLESHPAVRSPHVFYSSPPDSREDGVTIMRPTAIQRRGYKKEAFESHFDARLEDLVWAEQLEGYGCLAMNTCDVEKKVPPRQVSEKG